MSYRYSQLDHDNLEWFPRDNTRSTLLAIEIAWGSIRGLRDVTVEFRYPMTAIAGRNRSGKTTLLALAACAFHNSAKGYRQPGRKLSYFRFSDFFLQAAGEQPLGGIGIRYQILHNRWAITKWNRDREGPGWQLRQKGARGRWNNYDRRVNRAVVYLGIDRVVPHAEKSASKTYRRMFRAAALRGWEDRARETVGRILGADYNAFEYREHSKYRLPVVTAGDASYSGFNMGAGEDALFSVIASILDCPPGALILVDELELGLHEAAQLQLIDELKKLCLDRHIQIICTTHSPPLLEALPPEGRLFLERTGAEVEIIPGISAKFAAGKLADRPSRELDILVEDDLSALLVEACLSPGHRIRTRIVPVGSKSAVMHGLAARFREDRLDVVAVLDGDAAREREALIAHFLSTVEGRQVRERARDWAEQNVTFLPGDGSPERWIVETVGPATYQYLGTDFGLTNAQIDELYAAARRAVPHDEFFDAARLYNLNIGILSYRMAKAAATSSPDQVEALNEFLASRLP